MPGNVSDDVVFRPEYGGSDRTGYNIFPKESRHASYLLADYSPKYDTKEFRNYMDSDEFRYQKEFTEDELLSVSTQSEIYDESIGSSGVVILWQFILVWYLSSAGQHSLH